jgi:hypothetical protein
MKVWIDKDLPTYKVGDLVWSKYHTNDLVYRITKIDRRFIADEWDKNLRGTTYPGCEIGDEYNPTALIETFIDLSVKNFLKKKIRKSTQQLDVSWLIKVTPEHIETHIKRLKDFLTTQFP